jgi:hypothetical protein
MKHGVPDDCEKHEEQKRQELVAFQFYHTIPVFVVVQCVHALLHSHLLKKDFMKGKHLFQILNRQPNVDGVEGLVV